MNLQAMGAFVVPASAQTLAAEPICSLGCRPSGHGATWTNIGALIIRIEFWGTLFYNCHKEPPKIIWVIKALILPRRADS